jgi:hypothetical protein
MNSPLHVCPGHTAVFLDQHDLDEAPGKALALIGVAMRSCCTHTLHLNADAKWSTVNALRIAQHRARLRAVEMCLHISGPVPHRLAKLTGPGSYVRLGDRCSRSPLHGTGADHGPADRPSVETSGR